MARLYDIDKAILACIDQETGEIVDAEALNDLVMQREAKVENVALWVKNLNADMVAFKAEKDAFAEREKQAKAKLESLKKWLSLALCGDKFSTSKVAVSFRKSVAVEIQDASALPKDFVVEKVEFAPDKTAIKNAIKAGQEVPGAVLIENTNISVK